MCHRSDRRSPRVITTKDADGYPFWLAKCLYWLDGAPKVTTVPGPNVRKACGLQLVWEHGYLPEKGVTLFLQREGAPYL